MKEFKVGDRIRAYGASSYGKTLPAVAIGRSGVVKELLGSGFISIHIDGRSSDGEYIFHPRQLVKLKPKKPLREFWINTYPSHAYTLHSSKEAADNTSCEGQINCIHVREVRKK